MKSGHSKVLLTGASGFVGRHVLEQWSDCEPLEDAAGIVDLTDAGRVASRVQGQNYSAVLHLAGETFVPSSFENPGHTFHVNVVGTVNLLSALVRGGFTGRFLYVSSGEVYGKVPAERLPIHESLPLQPGNPYAASKVAAEAACEYWRRGAGVDLVVARPFNHIGPGQDRRFAIADFARQLARIKLGPAPAELDVGNVEVTRDFTDVRDVVAAYRAIIETPAASGTYNVCAGKEMRLRDMIMEMAQILGVEVELKVNPSKLRSNDLARVRGDSGRLRSDTGWRPGIPLSESLRDIVDTCLREEIACDMR
jgi:GDP-4-dehydro-6-deoxy-D-mannose reductase